LIAARLIKNAPYSRNGFFAHSWGWNKNFNWAQDDKCKLEILCESDSEIEQSADVLGRPPSTVAYKARDLRLTLPQQWASIIAPKRRLKPIEIASPELAYPYIVKALPEHSDLLAINQLVPRSIGGDMRGDICQEIMVAILEGRTTLEALKSRQGTTAYFIRKFYKDNFEMNGHALSFSTVDEDCSYDEIASSIAAKEWHSNQRYEQTRYINSVRTFSPPTQFQAAWEDQVGRYQMSLHQIGQFLSREEVEELLDTPE
jgi:hypothetical protein